MGSSAVVCAMSGGFTQQGSFATAVCPNRPGRVWPSLPLWRRPAGLPSLWAMLRQNALPTAASPCDPHRCGGYAAVPVRIRRPARPAGGRRRAGQPRLPTGKPFRTRQEDGVCRRPAADPASSRCPNAPLLEKPNNTLAVGTSGPSPGSTAALFPPSPRIGADHEPAGGGSQLLPPISAPLLHRGSAEEACAFYASPPPRTFCAGKYSQAISPTPPSANRPFSPRLHTSHVRSGLAAPDRGGGGG